MDTLKRVHFGTLIVALLAGSTAIAKDKHRLVEASGKTTYKVTSSARIKGKLLTPVAKGPETVWKLNSSASYEFHERRITQPDERGASALRSIRRYSKAESQTSVGDHKTKVRLDRGSSYIVADGRSEGILFYCPTKQITRQSLDLLSSPADPLAISGMLPTEEVEIGEKWNPDQWVLQMLTDCEAVVESKLTCKLLSVSRKQARVSFTGKIEGASVGAAVLIDVKGSYICDLDAGYIRSFELTRKEKRSAGTVSPGLNVEVTVKCDRKREDIDLSGFEKLAATPTESQLALTYRSPWGIELRHGREWHVFNENDRTAVLRMVSDGNLVAQCNIARIAPVKPGTHTPEKQFLSDIRQSLGPRLTDLEPGKPLAQRPNYLFSAVAQGASDETKMQWSYFLSAAPTGQQVSMVYSIAQADVAKVGKTPEVIARTLRFPASARISRGK